MTIAPNFEAGGLQRVARNFALGYHRFGVESACFGYRGGGPLARPLSAAGLEVFLGSSEPTEQRSALARALAWRPDVIHVHRDGFADAGLAAMLIAAKQGRRRSTEAPVGIVETNVFGRVDYSADRDCIDVHYLISRWCLWKWQRWSANLAPRPLGVVLPNLVMHAEFNNRSIGPSIGLRRAHGIPDEAFVFGRVGSLHDGKWSPIMFAAFASYAADHEHAWLLLVGLPASLRTALNALPKPIRERVIVLDFIRDDDLLQEAYRAMDVFLHASRIGESFGMVLAEALLCGVPVISLSTPDRDNSQLEVVGHETGGLIVADLAGMVEAMRRLEDPAVRRRYAVQGASEIIRRFSPEALIPMAIDIAQVVSEGLSREHLARRLIGRPQLCSCVSNKEISTLLRGSIGRHSFLTHAVGKLASNPSVYKLYRRATGQPV